MIAVQSIIKYLFFIFIFVFLQDYGYPVESKKADDKYPPAKNFNVLKTESRIKIDGVLDEAAWKIAEKIEIKYEWSPGDASLPPVKSEVMVTFDKKYFYIAFKCYDPEPEKIRAHLMDRDNINTFIQDDHVSFMIDTFNDERRAFQFRVNPLGVQADAIFSELEGYEDFSWDAIWSSAGKINSEGYIVEVAIPFNQLRFPGDKSIQTWGIEADRSYPRNVRHRMSTHVRDRNRNCILCQFNKATGFIGMSAGKNIEFDPTLTVVKTDKLNDLSDTSLESGKIDLEPGISARWGITSNLIFNATLNPDFSQVEADVQELQVNKRFAIRYPEKRPFFLEGADFFLTPMEAIFTRTVFDPIWGGKLTGKMGKNAVGFYVAQDAFNNFLIPSNQGSRSVFRDEKIVNGVFRYRRDVGKGSAIGALYTGRTGDGYQNHVAGADGFFRLNRSKTITFQYLRSETEYPDEINKIYDQENGGFGGNAIYAMFSHFSRNFNYFIRYQDLSGGFRADSGFIPRVDMRLYEASFQPVLYGKRGGWFNRIFFQVMGRKITDHEGNLTDDKFYAKFAYQGPLQSVFQTALNLGREFYNGVLYRKNYLQIYSEIKPVGGIYGFLYTEVGDGIDYSNSLPGKKFTLMPGFEFGLGKHFNLNISHTFEKFTRDNKNVYTANLFQTKFVYNINIRTFVRAIVQYTHINRDPSMYIIPTSDQTKLLFTQFLFSYKINPQTVLFLGYSDNNFGMKGVDLIRTDRTFFLKIGYALVL